MIKLIRIDDRLLHGQVSFTWVPNLGSDCILVANDKIAKDDFQKMALGLAKPAGSKLLIKSLADAVSFLTDEKNKTLKILVLINSVQDASTLAARVSEINTINFGGIRAKDGAKLISKAVALTEDDLTHIKDLLEKGIELEIRQLPSDEKLFVSNLIQAL